MYMERFIASAFWKTPPFAVQLEFTPKENIMALYNAVNLLRFIGTSWNKLFRF